MHLSAAPPESGRVADRRLDRTRLLAPPGRKLLGHHLPAISCRYPVVRKGSFFPILPDALGPNWA
ncbi:hypothetical protein Psta_2587 [Pirellula staleyi DSM 6068]|uniref:Uncharacterized protein n=1 Tax=Pirellula staleyi (strain ATCC 27377 / DSM 6068 / ICPB 4128) TaxID=530564 RepID=D2R5S4_PIRSD|nr:hypothetical protein Psta_2587 [Pirellula staleyi DSM 6068]